MNLLIDCVRDTAGSTTGSSCGAGPRRSTKTAYYTASRVVSVAVVRMPGNIPEARERSSREKRNPGYCVPTGGRTELAGGQPGPLAFGIRHRCGGRGWEGVAIDYVYP